MVKRGTSSGSERQSLGLSEPEFNSVNHVADEVSRAFGSGISSAGKRAASIRSRLG